jgi:hypothetical protein
MRSSGFSAAEKSAVTAACQHLIDDFLKPRFLPTIRPTQFNYPVDILGKWHGTKYRFIQRYRSGFPENLGEEFDAPFARLDWISRNRFDLQWHRHTGEWFCLHRSLTFAEAIDCQSACKFDPVSASNFGSDAISMIICQIHGAPRSLA